MRQVDDKHKQKVLKFCKTKQPSTDVMVTIIPILNNLTVSIITKMHYYLHIHNLPLLQMDYLRMKSDPHSSASKIDSLLLDLPTLRIATTCFRHSFAGTCMIQHIQLAGISPTARIALGWVTFLALDFRCTQS